MAKENPDGDAPSRNTSLIDASQNQTAEYICDFLNSIQRVAANKDMAMLAHLIGLAKAEAKRNCRDHL